MRLRQLEKNDAPLMLEWMHDESVVENLQANFKDKTLSDCEKFISLAQDDNDNIHMAIVDDANVYMGTVSLKNIQDNTAEFAITIRACAMGKGYSKFAMTEIIRIGFEEYNLKIIYWCVSPENKRACRFYDKNNFKLIDIKQSDIFNSLLNISNYSNEQINKYNWYMIENNSLFN